MRGLLIWLLLGGWMGLQPIHPLKLSLCEIDQVEARLKLRFRFFADDFGAQVAKTYRMQAIDLATPTSPQREAIHRYIEERFQLRWGAHPLTWEIDSIQLNTKENVAWITAFTDSLPDASRLTVRNTLLLEAFPSQQNLVYVRLTHGEKVHWLFDSGEVEQGMEW